MTSTVVNREIRKYIRPVLKEQGFTKFTGRKAWRVRKRAVEVINFQSFNSYLAESLSCTTFSFGVNLGIYYQTVHNNPWTICSPPEFPQDSECHARRFLIKNVSQPEYSRPDIWYLDAEGSGLPIVIEDAKNAICEQGLGWLEEMSKLHTALEVFKTRAETFINGSIPIEMLGGTLNSMARAEVICGIALEFEDVNLAKSCLTNVMMNPFYRRMPDAVETLQTRLSMLERLEIEGHDI